MKFRDGYDDDAREQVNRLFATSLVERFRYARELYRTVAENAQFKVTASVGHKRTRTGQMNDDVQAFFKSALDGR